MRDLAIIVFTIIFVKSCCSHGMTTAYSCIWKEYDLIFTADVVNNKIIKQFNENGEKITLDIYNDTKTTAIANITVNDYTGLKYFTVVKCNKTE